MSKTELLTKNDNNYPVNVCLDCGYEAQENDKLIKPIGATNTGTCPICGEWSSLTSPRTFGNPNFIRITGEV